MSSSRTYLDLEIAPPPPELDRPLLVANARPLGWISDKVAEALERPTPIWWWAAFVPSFLLLLLLVY